MEVYSNSYLEKELLSRLNVNDLKRLVSLNSIELVVELPSLDSLEHIDIIKASKFLESLSGLKAISKDQGSRKSVRGYVLTKSVICKVTLRKRFMWNFLNYFRLIVIPLYLRRYGNLVLEEKEGRGVEIRFNDLNLFYNLRQDIDFQGVFKIMLNLKGDRQFYKFYVENIMMKVKENEI